MQRLIMSTIKEVGTTVDHINYDAEEFPCSIYYDEDVEAVVAEWSNKKYTLESIVTLLEDMKYIESKANQWT